MTGTALPTWRGTGSWWRPDERRLTGVFGFVRCADLCRGKEKATTQILSCSFG